MTKSGCEMTWNYYNDNTPTPNLIKWVGDRDLWKFQYPETKPITSVIREKGMDLEQWVKYLNEPELIGKLLTKGKVINDFTTNQHLIEANKLVKIWKEQGDIYKPIFTNLTYGISEILNNIVIHKDYPFKIAVSFRMQQNKALCSVRSVDDESAQHYAEVRKGGGHPNAAGFEMSLSELEPNIN
jgi:oligoribonuclease NrnB/cAMP/cGMP phosphodiesterase (DHH superfamily)